MKLSPGEQIAFLDSTYLELIESLKKANENSFIPFLIGIVSVYSESSCAVEIIDHIKKLNAELCLVISGLYRMNLIDLDKIAGLYGVTDLYDSKSDEIGHIPFTQEYYAAIGTYLSRKINAFKGPSYKVIALDCDNTLWKGICGEIGAMNVTIDENFSSLQEFVLEKYSEGFLLVLCSKNNKEDVWEVFDNHPHMKLKREHITAHRINWDIKSNNLLSISEELNLSIDSFVFIDDNEFEVEQMTRNCPNVLSISLPDEVSTFSEFLNHIWAFDVFHVTEEDTRRNKMYRIEKERNDEQVKHSSIEDFLISLDLKINIRPLENNDVDRAAQLTLRTNQFNLNGIRKTPHEVSSLIGREDFLTRIIEVSDRFGDYGIVGLVIANKMQNELVVETFLLSCRVLGRKVEDAILSELENYCRVHALNSIKLLFQPTLKNKPFQEFLSGKEWFEDAEAKNYYHPIKISEQINVL